MDDVITLNGVKYVREGAGVLYPTDREFTTPRGDLTQCFADGSVWLKVNGYESVAISKETMDIIIETRKRVQQNKHGK